MRRMKRHVPVAGLVVCAALAGLLSSPASARTGQQPEYSPARTGQRHVLVPARNARWHVWTPARNVRQPQWTPARVPGRNNWTPARTPRLELTPAQVQRWVVLPVVFRF